MYSLTSDIEYISPYVFHMNDRTVHIYNTAISEDLYEVTVNIKRNNGITTSETIKLDINQVKDMINSYQAYESSVNKRKEIKELDEERKKKIKKRK